MNETDKKQVHEQVLPDSLPKFDLPFYYGAFTNLGIDYLVPHAEAEKLLHEREEHKALSVAKFGGQACLSFNYQLYFGQFPNGGAVIQEIEFNIVSYPTAVAHQTPKLTYEQYAKGEDSTRHLGFCRYRVACDSPLAIAAGQELFGEPKFQADFQTTIPVPNATPQQWKSGENTWTVTCLKEGRGSVAEDEVEEIDRYFTFTVNLDGVPARPVSTAPFTEYGTRGKGHEARVLAAPLNVFQPYQWYDLKGTNEQSKKRVQLARGKASDPQITTFLAALGDKPVGAWLFQSPPVAAQNRPYYVPTTTK